MPPSDNQIPRHDGTATATADIDALRPLIEQMTTIQPPLWHQIAESTGLSPRRAAQQLVDLGVFSDIEQILSCDPPLPSPHLQLLNGDLIACATPPPPPVHIHWVTASTNSEAVQMLQSPDSEFPLAVTAEYQRAGRGRQGRQWLSPLARNIMLSVGSQLPRSALRHSGLSLAAGVAACRAFQSLGYAPSPSRPLGLKWPNDLMLGDAKLGGILIESRITQTSSQVAVVIGIGINLYLPLMLQQDIKMETAQLYNPTQQEIDRNLLLGTLAGHLCQLLQQWPERGFQDWQSEFEQWHVWRGQQVQIFRNGEAGVIGMLQGVDAGGALILRTTSGREEKFELGDISLRRHDAQGI